MFSITITGLTISSVDGNNWLLCDSEPSSPVQSAQLPADSDSESFPVVPSSHYKQI